MDLIKAFFEHVYNVRGIIEWGGTLAVAGIIYAETGLMLGFFLPGDSLLVTAGLLAASGLKGMPDIRWLVGLGCLAAVLGNATGYWIGLKAGKPLYRRKQTFFFRRDHLLRTREFYRKHGGKTIIIARFVPIVRTFAPVVAGIARMGYPRFFSYDIWGGTGWITSMCMIGYTLGASIPNISKYLHIVIAAVIFVSLIPIFVEVIRNKLKKAGAKAKKK